MSIININDRVVIDDWASATDQLATIVRLMEPAGPTLDHREFVWTVQFSKDGWGYGTQLEGKLIRSTVEYFCESRHLEVGIVVKLTADSDPRHVGYKTDDEVDIALSNIVWLERKS